MAGAPSVLYRFESKFRSHTYGSREQPLCPLVIDLDNLSRQAVDNSSRVQTGYRGR